MRTRKTLITKIRMFQMQKKRMESELLKKQRVLKSTTNRWRKTLMLQT